MHLWRSVNLYSICIARQKTETFCFILLLRRRETNVPKFWNCPTFAVLLQNDELHINITDCTLDHRTILRCNHAQHNYKHVACIISKLFRVYAERCNLTTKRTDPITSSHIGPWYRPSVACNNITRNGRKIWNSEFSTCTLQDTMQTALNYVGDI